MRLFVELVGHYPLHMAEASAGTCELQRDAFRKSHPSRGVRQFLQLFIDPDVRRLHPGQGAAQGWGRGGER